MKRSIKTMLAALVVPLSLAAPVLAEPKKEASDMLVVVLEAEAGKKTIHKQMVTSQACKSILKAFAEAPLVLTFTDPDVTGRVLDASCIRPDGEMVRPSK